jgi:chromate transporter
MTETTKTDHSPWAVFLIFLRLGLTSFGGPIAHLGYFRDEFVTRRQWLTERSYADLVALCQFLQGPASSQVGVALGLSRSGYAGALARSSALRWRWSIGDASVPGRPSGLSQ